MVPMRSGIAGLAVLVALLAPTPAPAQERAPVVGPGSRVSLEYTLRLDDGSLADSNVGGEPLAYVHGSGTLLPGLERALEGMAVGESKQGTLAPEDAFGKVDAALFVEVETSRIPERDRRAGAWLDYRDEHGERQRVRVHEVRGDRIVVDMNSPYAGSPIAYEVEVVKIE